MKNKITKNSNIAKVITDYPGTAEVFLEYGMHCVGCIASVVDSIEAGAKIHGFNDEKIDEMVENINLVAQSGK